MSFNRAWSKENAYFAASLEEKLILELIKRAKDALIKAQPEVATSLLLSIKEHYGVDKKMPMNISSQVSSLERYVRNSSLNFFGLMKDIFSPSSIANATPVEVEDTPKSVCGPN